jgi:hypothetical protein
MAELAKCSTATSDEAPSWRSERGWEECKPSAAGIYSSDGAENSTAHGGRGEGSWELESEIVQEAKASHRR